MIRGWIRLEEGVVMAVEAREGRKRAVHERKGCTGGTLEGGWRRVGKARQSAHIVVRKW